MYAALWRVLPGPLVVRILMLVVLAAIVMTALVVWVFPFVDAIITLQEVTVEE